MSEITPNTPNPVREDAYVEELAEKLGIDPQFIPKSPVWRNEEEIKAIAEMFSNMSGGSSGGGVLVVNEDENNTLDKTWQEINAAALSVLVLPDSETGMKAYYCVQMIGHNSEFGYFVNYGEDAGAFTTSSQTGYPIWDDPNNSGGGGDS